MCKGRTSGKSNFFCFVSFSFVLLILHEQEIGYKGDLGYHQLLYPNTSETRALLNWLTSKLPRTEQEHSSTSAEVDGKHP